MIKKPVILLVAALLCSCATIYSPDAEFIGENPASLVIRALSLDSNVRDSAVNLYKREINCDSVSETKPTMSYLGTIEMKKINPNQERVVLAKGYKIPSNTDLIVEMSYWTSSGFSREHCELSMLFKPEESAMYLLSRGARSNIYIGKTGGCVARVDKFIESEQGLKEVEIDNVSWGTVKEFKSQKFICDDKGQHRLKD